MSKFEYGTATTTIVPKLAKDEHLFLFARLLPSSQDLNISKKARQYISSPPSEVVIRPVALTDTYHTLKTKIFYSNSFENECLG